MFGRVLWKFELNMGIGDTWKKEMLRHEFNIDVYCSHHSLLSLLTDFKYWVDRSLLLFAITEWVGKDV